jgi:hypothetical protein
MFAIKSVDSDWKQTVIVLGYPVQELEMESCSLGSISSSRAIGAYSVWSKFLDTCSAEDHPWPRRPKIGERLQPHRARGLPARLAPWHPTIASRLPLKFDNKPALITLLHTYALLHYLLQPAGKSPTTSIAINMVRAPYIHCGSSCSLPHIVKSDIAFLSLRLTAIRLTL